MELGTDTSQISHRKEQLTAGSSRFKTTHAKDNSKKLFSNHLSENLKRCLQTINLELQNSLSLTDYLGMIQWVIGNDLLTHENTASREARKFDTQETCSYIWLIRFFFFTFFPKDNKFSDSFIQAEAFLFFLFCLFEDKQLS